MPKRTHQSYDGEYTLRYIGSYSDGESVIELEREGVTCAVFHAEVAAQLAVDILDKVNYAPIAIASIENVVEGRVAEEKKRRRIRELNRKQQERYTELKRQTSLKYFKVPFDGLGLDEQQIVMDHVYATVKREEGK